MPLGSTRDMPAASCEEVKKSEGEAALCKNWVKPNSSAETTLMNCYLEAKGMSEHYTVSQIITSGSLITMARFMLETNNPSGRNWANIFSASDNSSVHKYRQTDELSVQTNYLLSSSW